MCWRFQISTISRSAAFCCLVLVSALPSVFFGMPIPGGRTRSFSTASTPFFSPPFSPIASAFLPAFLATGLSSRMSPVAASPGITTYWFRSPFMSFCPPWAFGRHFSLASEKRKLPCKIHPKKTAPQKVLMLPSRYSPVLIPTAPLLAFYFGGSSAASLLIPMQASACPGLPITSPCP